MNSVSHKPGSDSGVDYGIAVIFLLWILATLVLVVLIAIKGIGNADTEVQFHRPVKAEITRCVPQFEARATTTQDIGESYAC
jgi:hypothetical protein